MDISFSGIADAAACHAIARGLRGNHTLLGLHAQGNALVVDACGFARYDRRYMHPANWHAGTPPLI